MTRFIAVSAARHERTRRGVGGLCRLACVLPAAVMATWVIGVALFLNSTALSARTTRLVEVIAAAGAFAVLAGAFAGAELLARRVNPRLEADAVARLAYERLSVLRAVNARGLDELHQLVELIKHGERREPRGICPAPEQTADPFELFEFELRRMQVAMEHAVLNAADLTPDTVRLGAVWVNLALRMQSFVHRAIALLDRLEVQVEDPVLLKDLFRIDHLATLLRRQAENLGVLGGVASRRRWTNPVAIYEVLRSAVAEVEDYARVKLVLPLDGTVRGDAVAHIVHLVAELIENATKFSRPDSHVLIRAEKVSAGLAVEIEDRGLGIDAADRRRINEMLADPGRVNVGELAREGRIGLYVVARLAHWHAVNVELKRNVYGGTSAVVVLSPNLVDTEPDRPAQASTPIHQPAPAAIPAAAARSPRPASNDPTTDGVVRSAAARDPAPPYEPYRGAVDAGDDRPPLPQRRAQHSLAPELRETPASWNGGADDTATPELIAGFLAGVHRSDDETRNPTDGTD